MTIEGIARRATRIAVDGAARQKQVGADHYWEVFVFVNTPLLAVNNRTQDTYPIVCCVRTLPAGMPTGEQISERVRISGFALKRYGYPLADLEISSSQGDVRTKGERMRACRHAKPRAATCCIAAGQRAHSRPMKPSAPLGVTAARLAAGMTSRARRRGLPVSAG